MHIVLPNSTAHPLCDYDFAVLLLLLLLALLSCRVRDDTTKMTGHFDGYVEVHSKDEVAVMEALMKHGPLAVGVDASFDEFLFYR